MLYVYQHIIIKVIYISNNKICDVIFVHKSKNDIALVQCPFFSGLRMSRIFWLKMIAVMTIVTCSTMKSSFPPPPPSPFFSPHLQSQDLASLLSYRFVKGKSQKLTKSDIVLILVVIFFVIYTTLRAVPFVLGGSKSLLCISKIRKKIIFKNCKSIMRQHLKDC